MYAQKLDILDIMIEFRERLEDKVLGFLFTLFLLVAALGLIAFLLVKGLIGILHVVYEWLVPHIKNLRI